MLTITTEKRVICINIDLLKKRFKSAFITLLKVSTFILALAGIFWIISTAGEADNYNTPFKQIVIQFFQGFFCCGVAWVLNFIKLVIE